ncbi:MAG TPA: histidinol dehydrogenase [Chthoniobacteraceae bacterium]|jgi:histidinol dehydrogenase|nr:histidinol dehydrogenase [Chthoniobacteraceae bacterium]
MKILKPGTPNYRTSLAALDRSAEPDPRVRDTVARVITDIRAHGDAALIEYTEKFGGPRLKPNQLRVSAAERRAAEKKVDASTRKAIATAHANVLDFAKKSLRKSWTGKNRQGGKVGERFDPFERVGIYVPGGTAPLVSTAIMTCTLAAAAGVPEIVVATPADKRGAVNPALLHALGAAGATEVYKVGGAQAVAALAYGTRSIRPVLKIFGPGNAYVVEAKRQCFGRVAVDLLPGPSEILIIADATANAAWIASDMLAQAEHGHGSAVIFVTDSAKKLSEVADEFEGQLSKLARQEHLREVAERTTHLILVKKLDEAIKIANGFAPEHLMILARDDEKIAAQIRTAGAIFLGGYSPVVAGDFVAGPSHELPTGGAGKSFPGLTVDQFQRRTSLVRLDKKSLSALLPTIQTFSQIEGLDAHGHSASIRFE